MKAGDNATTAFRVNGKCQAYFSTDAKGGLVRFEFEPDYLNPDFFAHFTKRRYRLHGATLKFVGSKAEVVFGELEAKRGD